jgi:Right handed beta helix region
MKRRTLVSFVVVLSTLAVASFAHAQATRTWVSGVGDDVNPCSRTAPCKTYAGAISKTAPGGIISTLDPGGFGAVTITKSITIEGTGTLGHILNSLVNGVIINAATTDVVVLRDLSLHGAGNGLNGVRILGAAEVYFQNVNIQNNAGDGIDIAPSVGTLTKVFVENSRIVNNTGKGIEVIPTGTATVKLSVQTSEISGNGSNGIDVTGNNNSAAIYNSKMAHNGLNGAQVQLTSSTLFIESSLIAYNGTGVTSGLAGQTPVTRLSGNMIVGNITNGVTGGGTTIGFSNNTIVGNGGSNTVTTTVPQQ